MARASPAWRGAGEWSRSRDGLRHRRLPRPSLRPRQAASARAPSPRGRSRRCHGGPASARDRSRWHRPHRPAARWPARRARPRPPASGESRVGCQEPLDLRLVLAPAAASRWHRRAGRPASPAARRSPGCGAARSTSSSMSWRLTDATWHRDCAARCRCRCRAHPPARGRSCAGMALDPGIALARQAATLDIMHAGAVAAACAARSTRPLQHVAGHELALVLHGGRQREGLAPGAGAEIDDPHGRPCASTSRADQLGAFVLHLDQPGR